MMLQIKFSHLKFISWYVSPFLVTIQPFLSSELAHDVFPIEAIAKTFSKKSKMCKLNCSFNCK